MGEELVTQQDYTTYSIQQFQTPSAQSPLRNRVFHSSVQQETLHVEFRLKTHLQNYLLSSSLLYKPIKN